MRRWRAFFSALAALLAAGAIWISFSCVDQTPVLLQVPEAVPETARDFMDAICSGDSEQAQRLLYGQPDPGIHPDSEDPVGELLWQAWQDSLDYRLVGECYADRTGIVQDVKIISMDLPTATAHLRQRAQRLLEERVAAAEDPSEIYDSRNNYRDTIVRDILQEATAQALEEDVRYTYRIVPVHLTYSEGKWYVYPTEELMNTISGETVQEAE